MVQFFSFTMRKHGAARQTDLMCSAQKYLIAFITGINNFFPVHMARQWKADMISESVLLQVEHFNNFAHIPRRLNTHTVCKKCNKFQCSHTFFLSHPQDRRNNVIIPF